ncbi:hypothetical protein [uncultured Draconibacterium sp.]|uniref:hypothetical protein n=1 Tax=uncultured Draconibacterium sp. TaxID=1573823 RepID=UPI0025EB0492|nr:hypothetical protein [uncultured Draconibacterium sp.]
MGKAFILLMLGIVVWLSESGLNYRKSTTKGIKQILNLILKITFNHNLLKAELAGAGRFPNRFAKINLVKTGIDYMLQMQNQPVDANT